MKVVAETVCCSGVADDEVLVAPFFTKDFGKQVIVRNSGDAVVS